MTSELANRKKKIYMCLVEISVVDSTGSLAQNSPALFQSKNIMHF